MRTAGLRRGKPLKRSTPLKRGPPPKRGAPPKRRSFLNRIASLARKVALKKVNPERAKKARARDFGDHAKFVVQYPCVAVGRGCWGPIDPGHKRKRSGGGTKEANLFPICRGHHREQEGRTEEFERKYGLDLEAICVELWEANDGRR